MPLPLPASRRSFLLGSGGALSGAWLACQWPHIAAAAEHASEVSDSLRTHHFESLSGAQAADVDALAGQIVPSGATPGAREAGAVYFIDRALATFFASWASEFYAGLTQAQQRFHALHPSLASFAAARSDAQLAFMQSLEWTPFFENLRTLTVLGLLASPKYGGNRGGAGWKMIGFEDQHVFEPPFGDYDRDYPGFVPYPRSK